MAKKGTLVVFSAPSGTGKSTILKQLRKIFPNSAYSISYTTREPRPGEINGKDYFFVSKEKFLKMAKEGQFIEWEEILGNFYGTSKRFIEESLDKGKILLMDIDVKGAKNIKKMFPEALLIFIKPPSIEELKKRLLKRGTEPLDVIENRLKLAEEELKLEDQFDYVVVNQDLETAIKEIQEIISRKWNG